MIPVRSAARKSNPPVATNATRVEHPREFIDVGGPNAHQDSGQGLALDSFRGRNHEISKARTNKF